MDDVYLKPCPRCGGKAASDEAISFRTEWGKGIHCDDCGFWTGDEMSLEEAIAWWNEQPLIDNLCARITELEERLAEQTKATAGMFGVSAYWEKEARALTAELAALRTQPTWEPVETYSEIYIEAEDGVKYTIGIDGDDNLYVLNRATNSIVTLPPDRYRLCRLVQQQPQENSE